MASGQKSRSQGLQQACETSRPRVVASTIESHIENDVAGTVRAHLIRRSVEEVADSLRARIRVVGSAREDDGRSFRAV